MASAGRARMLASVLASLALLVSASAAHAAASTEVAGTQPGWATPDNQAGDEPGSDRMVFSVWLDWRNGGELSQLLADQQNPASPAYQRWLSSDEFRARFAPTQATYDSVATWLRNQGFDVLASPRNRLSVSAEGYGRRGREGLPGQRGPLPPRPRAGARAQPRAAHPRRPGRQRARHHRPGRRHEPGPAARRPARAAAPDRPLGRPLLALLGRALEPLLPEPVLSRAGPCPGSCAGTRRARSARPTASPGCTASASTAAARRS